MDGGRLVGSFVGLTKGPAMKESSSIGSQPRETDSGFYHRGISAAGNGPSHEPSSLARCGNVRNCRWLIVIASSSLSLSIVHVAVRAKVCPHFIPRYLESIDRVFFTTRTLLCAKPHPSAHAPS
jgi:hypothetical protein